MENKYKADSIESLSPLEHVQMRPGMYVGNTEDATQLLIEILGNSIDEHNIGHGNIIKVKITDDCVSVEDEGQGFPIGIVREQDGETVLTASFDCLNTSGKYDDDGVYNGTGIGINGEGSKITNFLSDWLEVRSWNEQGIEEVKFENGIKVSGNVDKTKQKTSGTYVAFKPSAKYFDYPNANMSKVKKFCSEITCLCPNLTIVLNDIEYHNPNGIKDFLSTVVNDEMSITKSFCFKDENQKQKIDLGMLYTTNTSTSITAYVNCGATKSGPHFTMLKGTITRVLNKWGKDNGFLKAKDKNLDGGSLQEGLVLVVSFTSDKVSYEAQVKSVVAKIDTSWFNTTFAAHLEKWLDNNPQEGKTIIERALLARKAAEAARKARENVQKKIVKNKTDFLEMPTKLVDCWSKDRSKCELLVTEGLSASSGLVAARDSETQAVYAVRGKMYNPLKGGTDKIMKNQEINNLILALGLDFDAKTGKMVYNKKKLRYDKIIAACDADFDGFSIENLLFNILWYLCPELLINGHVYSSVPPLFRITTKKNEYVYLKDDKEMEHYKERHKNDIKTISRNKGLGEMDSDELSYCLLDNKTRNMVQLIVKDVDKINDMFNTFYGKDVQKRLEYILEHSEEARED